MPQNEADLLLVDQTGYKMRYYRQAKLTGEYEIGLGQGKGWKIEQSDNKTPKGMYFVIDKHRGPFNGPYGAYYGSYWLKINYPNSYDAERGKAKGMISSAQQEEIRTSWSKRSPTLQNTKLGGGIGFHGWIQEWNNGGPRHLSWGCVVLHLYDIAKLYDQIPLGSMVVIF